MTDKPLSYAQANALSLVRDDWTDKPATVSWPTIDSLKRRGLVETRYAQSTGHTWKTWQWRKMPPSPPWGT